MGRRLLTCNCPSAARATVHSTSFWGLRIAAKVATVLAEYVLMLACAGAATLAVQLPPNGALMLAIGGGCVYGLLMGSIGWLEQRSAQRSQLGLLATRCANLA